MRTDDTGAVRVIAEPRTFVELVEAAFDRIARFGAWNDYQYFHLGTLRPRTRCYAFDSRRARG